MNGMCTAEHLCHDPLFSAISECRAVTEQCRQITEDVKNKLNAGALNGKDADIAYVNSLRSQIADLQRQIDELKRGVG